MTAAEFWDACNGFDWYYDFSDDPRVHRAGERRAAELRAEAPAGSDNRRIYEAFSAHHFSGEPFGTPKAPKPDRPA